MRRADRLFQIIQLLRGRRVLTARRLAERLEVSERTIYRDVSDLVLSGVPVEGEAGVGYMLRDYDLPPLMFSRAEVEALVLGARIVQSWADPELARAAKDVLSKVETVLPRNRRDLVEGTALYAPSMHHQAPLTVDVAQLRGAIRDGRKTRIRYTDAKTVSTRRIIRPLAISFYGPVWLLSGWCELRRDFRVFRLDRIASMKVLDETFLPEPGPTLEDFLNQAEYDPIR